MTDQMHKPARRSLDRRQFLLHSAAGGAALAGSSAVLGRATQAQGKTVSVASYGGLIHDLEVRLYAKPFEEKTDIKVTIGDGASMALAKLQKTSGTAAQWDIISLSGPEYIEAVKDGLIAPYDYSIIDTKDIVPAYKKSHGIPFSLYLFVMAWDTRQIPADKGPQSWADFWDTNKFKGKRSLLANIVDGCSLEIALLADGVPLDKLYPLDVDRALKSLERLGRNNIIWHNTNAEPMQQITSGAVSLATCFNGRAVNAIAGGGAVAYNSFNAGVTGTAYCVSTASANKKEAFELLNYMLNAGPAGVEYIKTTHYTVPNMAITKLVPQDIVDQLATSDKLKDKVFIKDNEWWAANLARVTGKFKEWQLAG